MPLTTRAGLAALLIATSALSQTPTASNWDYADAATVRLAPEAIDALPQPIRQALTRLACTIPQVHLAERPENFITGRFVAANKTNVAVLCSRNKISSILVFDIASAQQLAELAKTPDRDFLQDVGNGRIGFSRSLNIAPPQSIRKYHTRHGGTALPSLDHDGIEDAFAEKGSVIWYRHEGHWQQLMGSD